MPIDMKARVVANDKIAPSIHLLTFAAAKIAEEAIAGQFIHVYCGDNLTLRRPFSICDTDKTKGTVQIGVEVKGPGTAYLSKLKVGQKNYIMGPLGNGFTVNPDHYKIAMISGGAGAFPLMFLAKSLPPSVRHLFGGFRTAERFVLRERYDDLTMTVIATDDGSLGYKGLITDQFDKALNQEGWYDAIYACGPRPMLKRVAELAAKWKIPCQIAMENIIVCGYGACLGCVIPVRDALGKQINKRVCKDGPVFDSREIIF